MQAERRRDEKTGGRIEAQVTKVEEAENSKGVPTDSTGTPFLVFASAYCFTPTNVESVP